MVRTRPLALRPIVGLALTLSVATFLPASERVALAQEVPPQIRAVLVQATAAFRNGRLEAAVEGFDEVARQAPAYAPYLWQRGIALYYAERFDDCRRQFESHRTVNPNDVENAVWHVLCAARLTSVEAAQVGMLPVGFDPRTPMRQIYEMFGGLGTPEDVIAATTNDDRAQFYAELYLGLYYEAVGDAARALEHIRQATTPRFAAAGGYMHDVARMHLQLREAGR